MEKFIRKSARILPAIILLVLLIVSSGFICTENYRGIEVPGKKLFEYFSKNIAPVLKPYRLDFDKKLSKDELLQVENIREKVKSAIEKRKQAGLPKGREKLAKELSDSEVALLKQTRNEFFKAFLYASLVVDNHQEELETIFKNKDVNQKKWIEEMTEIITENSGVKLWAIKPVVKQNIQKLLPAENLVYAMFILWNPDKPMFKNQ